MLLVSPLNMDMSGLSLITSHCICNVKFKHPGITATFTGTDYTMLHMDLSSD